MRKAFLLASIVVAAALVTAGDDDGEQSSPRPAAAKAATEIRISDYLYSPSPATVRAVAKLSIVNTDAAPHTVTDKGAGRAFDSGTIKGARRVRDVRAPRALRPLLRVSPDDGGHRGGHEVADFAAGAAGISRRAREAAV